MRHRARSVVFAFFAAFAALSPESSFAGVGRWTSGGPDGAAVRALVAVPSEPSTVYLATARRLYKSVDAGASWAPTGLSGSVGPIVTTSTPSVVYAFGFESSHRTTDGGATWVTRPRPFRSVDAASVDRNDSRTLYVVTGGTLFRTTDGGDSWQPLWNLRGQAGGVAVDPADSAAVYAATTTGIQRSRDRGATWSQTSFRQPALRLLFDPRDDSRLFAITSAGLQVTTNRGQTWRRLAPEVRFPSRLAIDPSDSNRLYIVSEGAVFASSDGGETAALVHDGNVGVITVSGSSVVLAATATGIDRSEDAGRGWRGTTLGIREVPVLSLAIDPANPADVFAGSSQGIYRSPDGGGSWNVIPRSPGGNVIAIDPANRSTLYAAAQGIYKSTDGGSTWSNRSPASLANYVADFLIDPNNPRRVFASYGVIARSQDGAENWETVLRAEDTVASYYYPPAYEAMAVAPSDTATIYAAGDTNEYQNGLFSRSEDGGATWSSVTLELPSITALAVDPCDPRVVYAGTWSGVYRSLDGGATWSDAQLGYAVTALVTDPRHSSSVFAATRSGLFWTNDSGETWAPFEPAFSIPIFSLAIDPSGRFLHLGTNEGVFDLERTFDACTAGPGRLCLLGARFELSVVARDPRSGEAITGRAVPDGDRFGYFSFPAVTGDATFPEVFVKMADASGLPGPHGGNVWAFHSSLTDLDYTLTVRDTQTGRVRTYEAERFAFSSALSCGEADTRAFDGACSARPLSAPASGIRAHAASSPTLSLLGGRFRATVRAMDPRSGRTVEGEAVTRADGFGYFSLPGFTGDPSFPEVFVKMTDGTSAPGSSFWVFHTGLTDVAYTLTVTDEATGTVKTYGRGAPAGAELCGDADTSAFRN
jgi:photosystem II stability/assembly factor-like uncharacterized protein